MYNLILILIFVLFERVLCDNYSFINLPDEHLPYYFSNYPEIAKKCLKDPECPYKRFATEKDKCWGYEGPLCGEDQYSFPKCRRKTGMWEGEDFFANNFFYEADFGYIRNQLKELTVLCEPLFSTDSSLECSKHLRFCRGRNLMINFTGLPDRHEPIRYRMDVLIKGEIGGYCDFHEGKLHENADHISPLQSWGPEMRFFTKLPRRPIVENDCDVVVEKPTFILKIDATVNMYHHFCDFFNLYASLHLNSSHPEAFSTDVHILIWESYTYHSSFAPTWEAFTDHPIWDLKTFRGETVCFKNVVFPLLPRMIFGLYYNTPITPNCENSGLFRAFSEHILHRLKIPFLKRTNKKVRITLLSRDTKYRRILNENELLEAIQKNPDYDVQKVVFDRNLNFKKQLEISRNTDVFIGIHGAGLTHLLFLPDWASVFELYNCDDANCYYDLARLRGVKYVTWEHKDKLTCDREFKEEPHAKFANYYFDVNEFVRLVDKAANFVKEHPKFKELISDVSEDKKRHEEL